uniref:Putative exocyst complex subunit sec6 n=1 Tax=Xenopsylla cheopis TaxID=163159 RepID=A0A6M2DID1_XENCH
MDEEAKIADAKKYVINMLQRPGQLEKVEQYKFRVSRKKASIEAKLKNAIQSKLDGVRTGLAQLQACDKEIPSIQTKLDEIQNAFKCVPDLYNSLHEVRNENMRHSQYVTAIENLKHIFTVPDSVKRTEQWINEGKLLHTHQCLSDLENSRDDLLYELHKLPNQSPYDKGMLKACFNDVESLSDVLEKQLRLILGRTLNTVRKEPTVIVTALRIIEREEKTDQFALQQHRQSGFLPPGRPKKWREKAMQVLEQSVAQRIEGTHVDEREDNKLWLVRYLELTRQLILEDLRVVKTLCVPCFPPHYDILNTYVNMYHTCLSRHLQELIGNGLEGNEYVSVLSWILNTYSGLELMNNPELNIDISKFGPLLPESVLVKMQSEYLENMEKNYADWLSKTLEKENQSWQSGNPPEEDDQTGYFHTSEPIIIFQMVDQNLTVTNTISKELTFKSLLLSIDQISKYGNMYRAKIVEFKSRHFKDRSLVPLFTHYMISIVNNSLQIGELAQQMKQRFWPRGFHDGPGETKFENLLHIFQELRDLAASFLLEEAFLDLESHFEDLFTTNWIGSSEAVDTICVTFQDYFQDYNHLRPKNFEYVITEAQNLVTKRYITAMFSKKISFRNYDECMNVANKVLKEIKQIVSFFTKIAPKVGNFDSPFDVVNMLAEVLKCEDADMLSLDLHSLVEKYPAITEDHLLRLLHLRGDIPRTDIKEKVAYITETRKAKPSHGIQDSIFKQIVFTDRILNW